MATSPDMTAYNTQLAALKTSVQTMVQAVVDVKNNATTAENALKLEGQTLAQITESIVGATSLTIADLATDLETFKARTDNPHNVTKDQVGLALVENLATSLLADVQATTVADDKLNDSNHVTVAAAYHLAEKAIEEISGAAPETLDTINEIAAALQNNPDVLTTIQDNLALKATKVELTDAIAALTRESVGLGNVENYGIATELEAMDTSMNTAYMTPARTHIVADSVRGDITTMMADLTAEFNAGATTIANG